MQYKYWKAVIRYGHVGYQNEVSVARYLVFDSNSHSTDVMTEVQTMPGTKNKCIVLLNQIAEEEYLNGKKLEQKDFYLQNLFLESTA